MEDLAQATGQAAGPDRELVHDALEPARQFAPVLRASGLRRAGTIRRAVAGGWSTG